MQRKAITANWIEQTIRDFLDDPASNSLGGHFKEKAWDHPIVGFSNGGDPLYQKLKEDIGQFYWTPIGLFQRIFPDSKATADELTVICWILPQTEPTKSDNRKELVHVSERWARSRTFGEVINDNLRRHLVEKLREAGYEAVAPIVSPFWERKTSEKYGFASTWSERHAAYVSGLGTFGLSDGLITPGGMAMRCGSVIARIKIPPTERPYKDHHEYCLFYKEQICGRCIARCPAGAITKKGHDKVKCQDYLHQKMNEYVKANFGFEGYGCGLCQTKVPCESKIPTPSDLKQEAP